MVGERAAARDTAASTHPTAAAACSPAWRGAHRWRPSPSRDRTLCCNQGRRSCLHSAAAPLSTVRWRGLLPAALRPAARPWPRRATRHPAAVRPQIVATAATPEQPHGIPSNVGSAVEQRRRREWEATRQELAAFQQAHGRLPRETATALGPLAEGEWRLARWCTLQRRRKEGSAGSPVSAEERAALEAIPDWHWLARRRGVRVLWERRLQQVADFAAQHGRLPRVHVRATSPTPPLPLERELGMWCDRQRQRRKGSQKPELTAGEAAALEAVPGWWWEEFSVQPWEERRERVAAFQQQHGRLPRANAGRQSPLLEGERELGVWCRMQWQRRKGNLDSSGELTSEQVAALETIPGWYWEEWSVQPWQQRRNQVAAFQQQHGRLPREKGGQQSPLLEGERELGFWCGRQRWKGNRGPGSELRGEQQAVLEAIPGWFW